MNTMLVFVHGIGGRPDHFAPLQEALQRVGVSQPVTNFALPGHLEPLGEPLDVTATARQLLSALVSEPGTGSPAILVGHSTGGVVAMQAATLDQAPVAGVIVIDSNVPIHPLAVEEKLAKAQIANEPDWRSRMRASLLADWVGPDVWREKVFRDLDDSPDASLHTLWSSVLNTDSARLWNRLAVPVLYLQSTRRLKSSDFSELGNVQLVQVGRGHWPHLDDPQLIADVIGGWVEKL